MNDERVRHIESADEFLRIVRSDVVRDVDVMSTYEKIKKVLVLPEHEITDYAGLMRAQNVLESCAFEAYRLYQQAKRRLLEWELEFQPKFGEMRDRARLVLQAEKESKERIKQITEADITDKVNVLFKLEWAAAQLTHMDYKLAVDRFAELNELVKQRCRSVCGMLAKLRV